MSTKDEFETKIRELVKAGAFVIVRKHIEIDRAYREIRKVHVEQVLKNGYLHAMPSLNGELHWRGLDVGKRELNLLCRLFDEKDELVIFRADDAVLILVGTTYEPGKKEADAQMRLNWLKSHADWEEAQGGQGYVRRK